MYKCVYSLCCLVSIANCFRYIFKIFVKMNCLYWQINILYYKAQNHYDTYTKLNKYSIQFSKILYYNGSWFADVPRQQILFKKLCASPVWLLVPKKVCVCIKLTYGLCNCESNVKAKFKKRPVWNVHYSPFNST